MSLVLRRKHEATDKNHNVNKSSTNEDFKKSYPNENKTIYILFISLVIDLLAFTLILPLFPLSTCLILQVRFDQPWLA